MSIVDSSLCAVLRGGGGRHQIGRGSCLLLGLVIAILIVNPMVLQRDLISQPGITEDLSDCAGSDISGIPSTFNPFYDSGGNYLAYEETAGFDSNGVILTSWQGNVTYSPLLIARYTVEIYTYCLNHNNWSASLLNKIKNQIAWLHANESQYGDHSIWLFRYGNTREVNQTTPWWSATTSSWVIAAFLDSYSLFGSQSDLASAWRAMKAYAHSMDDHGLATNWSGTVWYEEYACNTTRAVEDPQHFLNGLISSLQGLYYFFEFNGSSLARSLFDDGVDSLKLRMREFDTGMWEKYSVTDPRATLGIMSVRITLFDWLRRTTSDPEIYSWYNRTVWMWNLRSSGYMPTGIEVTSIGGSSGTGYLTDKSLYQGAWVGHTPATMIVDLGKDRPISFVGYYSPYLFSAPVNWTLYSMTNTSDWKERAVIANSFEFDKAVVFKDPFIARYLRFEFRDSHAWDSIIAIDEIIISNASSSDLSQASLSIEDKRFNCTYGRIQVNVLNGTSIRVDGGEWFTSSGNYTVWLIAGPHLFTFNYNGKFTNKTIDVIYATTVRYDAVPVVYDYSLLLIVLAIAGGAALAILIGIYSVRRYRRYEVKKDHGVTKELRGESFSGDIHKKNK